MPITAVTFDLEGTAVDVEAAHHQGHIAVAADYGFRLTFEEALQKIPHFIGGPDEKVCEDIRALLDTKIANNTSVEELLKKDKSYYEYFLSTMPIDPRPGFVEIFGILNRAGFPMAIGSLTPEKQAETLLTRSGLGDLFGPSHIVLKEHVKREKPWPDVFLRTAEILGHPPSEQLVFEDSPRGGKAAIAAGSKFVGMPVVIRPATVSALVEAGASRIFYDWREINILSLIENLS